MASEDSLLAGEADPSAEAFVSALGFAEEDGFLVACGPFADGLAGAVQNGDESVVEAEGGIAIVGQDHGLDSGGQMDAPEPFA